MGDEQQCGNCRFHVWDECHFMPPIGRGEGGYTLWPLVYNDDWCGQWQPKDSPVDD